jgi:acetyl esterase/lipase
MTDIAPASMPQPLETTFAALLEALPDLTIDADRLPEIRELMAALVVPPDLDGVDMVEHEVDAAAGIVVRVLSPAGATAAARPAVFWIHGGGYIIGNRFMDDSRSATWVRELDCVVTSVEYRLAPEHPFPVPLEDCYAGLTWVHDHADELGIDTDRLGIGGLSAGGGLAAALAILARERGGPVVAFQLLDSPMLDDRQLTPSSRADWLAVWSRDSNTFGWQSYLGDLYGRDDVPDPAVPARVADLSGLPPALVIVGAADGFCDEDIVFAARLNQAGVPAELHVYPGAPHGFAIFGDSLVSQQAAVDVLRWLGRRFTETAER